jgi:hypothetical protein
MLIDRPNATVELDGKSFDGQSLEIVITPESAGAHIKYCHFKNFGRGVALTIKSHGSTLGRVLFPNYPEVFIQNCFFDCAITS